MRSPPGQLVQMPLPPVKPLIRRTIKRFIRLLPSLMLLLFVVSLIFVTLMQIAVIHTHRRSISAASTTNSTLSFPNNNQVTSLTVVRTPNTTQNEPKKIPTNRRVEVLRIEALLEKSPPSVEANLKILQNYINSGRIKEIIRSAQEHNRRLLDNILLNESAILTADDLMRLESGDESTSFGSASNNIDNDNSNNNSRGSIINYKPNPLLNHFDDNNDVGWSIDNKSTNNIGTNPIRSKNLCPAVPPSLIGRVQINTKLSVDVSRVAGLNPEVSSDGGWHPKHCHPRHRVAIIIPYRDRLHHLANLLYYLHPILQRQLISYKIYVVEQFGNDTFNKGVLMNAGVREALKERDYHCFVFHDVDLIPEDDRNLYSCPPFPRHMSVAIDKFNYTLPYKDLVGGVFAIPKAHFILVNGYSNLYWGWGGEDDDMATRVNSHNLPILRPPDSVGRYTMIKHNHRAESPSNVRFALLKMAKRRAVRDGLASVRYNLVSKRPHHCFTHLLVEIGHIHKWHFPAPNKLVLHF